MPDLSVIIPSRHEPFLLHTVQDVLTHMRGDTEISVICDGAWPLEALPDHPRVTVLYHASARGQRGAVNQAARLSQATYIMKLDAHCAVDEGFDVKLMAECDGDWTVIPRMYNLHVFDWVCHCGDR